MLIKEIFLFSLESTIIVWLWRMNVIHRPKYLPFRELIQSVINYMELNMYRLKSFGFHKKQIVIIFDLF